MTAKAVQVGFTSTEYAYLTQVKTEELSEKIENVDIDKCT